MSKRFTKLNLSARQSLGALTAFTLTAALAVAGCTTDKMPGNGDPSSQGPLTGPMTSSTPGVGSSSGTGVTSQHLISTGPAGETSRSLDALTTAAERQLYEGRVLGVAIPGPNPYAGMVLPPTGQFINPSLSANPEITVNSSISSPATPVITSGADVGGAAGLFVATAAMGAPGVVGTTGTGAAITAAPAAGSALSSGAAITANSAALPTVSAATVSGGVRGVATGTNTVGLASTAGAVAPVTASAGTLASATGTMANASGVAIPIVSSATGVQAAGTTGPSVDPSVIQQGFAVAPAPVFSTPANVATPANTTSVLTPGMYAAGPGGATAINGNPSDVNATLVNPGPLPLAAGTSLANGNTGTLTPTITSARTPSPTLASNPPLSGANGTTFTHGTRITSRTAASTVRVASSHGVRSGGAAGTITTPASTVVVGPMTSSGSDVVTTSNGRVRAAQSSSGTISSPATVAGSARSRAVSSPGSFSSPITIVGNGRARAARLNATTTAPSTIAGTGRSRAVRLTTGRDGTIIVTNAK